MAADGVVPSVVIHLRDERRPSWGHSWVVVPRADGGEVRADDFDADGLSFVAIAVVVLGLTEGVPTGGALVRRFSLAAFAHGHGVCAVCIMSFLQLGIGEAQAVAHTLGAAVVVPKVMAADGVVPSI